MFVAKLFLGFPIEHDFSLKLDKVNPEIVSLFVKKGGDYLEKINFKGVSYLGKFVGDIADGTALELLEANIYSLLKKLVPEYSYEKIPLLLFPYSESSEEN